MILPKDVLPVENKYKMEHKHGWSKQKPTVFLDGERDRIDLQSGKIRANIFFPTLAQGIVPFINQFGKL